ncbi:invasion associated locus B family protein [Marinomonas sp. IMCC 4694]|uniref:invasion associated locus B family protein n=1 Tax=Marinomonas sp. IMCC 4694 TaxID=2605432 RepID=UPI0016531D05|nr:invasion associated locus B family protein [Marinomonas sp. IMCC 4694]
MTIMKMMCFMLGIAVSGLAISNETAENASTAYGDWGVQCGQKQNDTVEVCQATQMLWLEQDDKKQKLLTLLLMPSNDDGKILQLGLPLGVDLRPGIVIAVDDGKEESFDYALCSNLDCSSFVLMTQERLSAFEKGNVLKIGFRPFGSQQTVVLEASLKGFTKASNRVK